MDYIIEPERKTPIVARTELLVCGGGVAGVAAAFCAAQNAAKVLLLEKYGFLGGLVTAALVITTPPLNNGINIEIGRRLKEKNVYVPCEHSGEEVEWLQMHAFDPEIIKYEFLQMLQEENLDFILHTTIVGAIMEGPRIKGLIMENKAGRQAVLADMFIDATGDADVAAYAGAPFRLVKKPMTMMFNMVGVDTYKALKQLGEWGNLKKILKKAIDNKEISFNLGTLMEYGAPGVHAEKLVYDGEINIWSGNLLGLDGTNPRDLTKAEVITREHVFKLAQFLKNNISGFEQARIECTATQVGVRASRQIVGYANPTREEVMSKILHDCAVKPYIHSEMRLPFGVLLPQKVENLIIAGRCISAAEDIMGQLRLIPVCLATGQTAGVAAAMALKRKISPVNLNISALQMSLEEQGMILGLPKGIK